MKQWYKMQIDPDDQDCGEVMIYDMIGRDPWTGEGMTASDFDRDLRAIGPVKNINLRINSPGGDVMDAVAIHTMLKGHPATVTASIDGIAASAASLIAMAADKIVMPENAFMLIHKPRGFAMGTDDDMVAMASDLERMNTTFANTYAERSGQTPEDVTALMSEDRLMTAAEAKSLGYADEVGTAVKMAAAYNVALLPEKVRAVMVAALASAEPESKPVAEPVVKTPVVEEEAKPEPVVAKAAAAPAAPTYGDADMRETLDLCQIAGATSKTANAFVKAKTPVAKVREQLLAVRASASDRNEIDPTPPTTPKAHLDEWKELQARVKADMGIGGRK